MVLLPVSMATHRPGTWPGGGLQGQGLPRFLPTCLSFYGQLPGAQQGWFGPDPLLTIRKMSVPSRVWVSTWAPRRSQSRFQGLRNPHRDCLHPHRAPLCTFTARPAGVGCCGPRDWLPQVRPSARFELRLVKRFSLFSKQTLSTAQVGGPRGQLTGGPWVGAVTGALTLLICSLRRPMTFRWPFTTWMLR